MKHIIMRLNKLKKNTKAHVKTILSNDAIIIAKLREIGFAEGDEVEIMHFGPFGKTPICIRLNQTLIALRPDEASAIEVTIL